MRRDVILAGFMVTADEWDNLETAVRLQLVVAARQPPPRIASPPPSAPDYETYELVVSAA